MSSIFLYCHVLHVPSQILSSLAYMLFRPSCTLPTPNFSLVPEVQPKVYNISSTSPRNIAITVQPAIEYSQVNGRFQGYVVEYGTLGSQVSIHPGKKSRSYGMHYTVGSPYTVY